MSVLLDPKMAHPIARIASLQTSSTGGLRASPHRVAGFATSTGSAGHAGVTTSSQLTFDLDHSMKAAQLVELLPQGLPQLACGAFGQSFIGRKPLILLVGAQGLEPWTR
jgi:hypothetical protein